MPHSPPQATISNLEKPILSLSTREHKNQSCIPSNGSVVQELYRAQNTKPEPKVRVFSITELDPINSIGWILSITVGLSKPAEGIYDSLLVVVTQPLEALVALVATQQAAG